MAEKVFMFSESSIDSLPVNDQTKQAIKAAATAAFSSDEVSLVPVGTNVGLDTPITLERTGEKHRLNIGGVFYRVFAKVPPRGFDPNFRKADLKEIDFWQNYI